MSLEIKKKELELRRVETAKMEMELKIEERKEEIKRLEDHIKVQEQTEIKLAQEIDALKNK